MPRTSRTLRLALLTASTSLAAGAVLLPTGALAAPAAPHTITLPAERGGNDHEDRQGEDRNEDEGGSHGSGSDERERERDGEREPEGGGEHEGGGEDHSEPTDSEPTDSESGVVPEEYCDDPKGLPGLCVDGKPLPEGDDSVTVPQGSVPCLGVDTPEQCADRQRPPVPGGTGSSTIELAV